MLRTIIGAGLTILATILLAFYLIRSTGADEAPMQGTGFVAAELGGT